MVERTSSGQAAAIPPSRTSTGSLVVRLSSPPYSTTSGFMTFQMPGPEREKADGWPPSRPKLRQPPSSNAP